MTLWCREAAAVHVVISDRPTNPGSGFGKVQKKAKKLKKRPAGAREASARHLRSARCQ